MSSMSEPDELPLSEARLRLLNASLGRFEEFSEALEESLEELIVNRRFGRYNSVHALLLAWKTPENREVELVKQLAKVFENTLNFTTKRHEILPDQSEEPLTLELEAAVRKHAAADELLIIYYAGHGCLDKQGKTTTWEQTGDSATRENDVSLPLNWSGFENRLNLDIGIKSDILYIVDSTYKSRTYPPNSGGSKELLGTSQASDDYSFTTDLMDELQAHFSRPNSVSGSTLHSRMIKRQAERQIPKPYHLPLSENARLSSIVLASMTEDDPRRPATLRDKSQSVTLCMIRVKFPPGYLPNDSRYWWGECIDRFESVEKEGVATEPVDYVRRLDFQKVGQVHVILVLMPSALSRKIAKKMEWRAFAELETVDSEAALTDAILKKASRKAGLPT